MTTCWALLLADAHASHSFGWPHAAGPTCDCCGVMPRAQIRQGMGLEEAVWSRVDDGCLVIVRLVLQIALHICCQGMGLEEAVRSRADDECLVIVRLVLQIAFHICATCGVRIELYSVICRVCHINSGPLSRM